MTRSEYIRPVAADQRLEHLDILRGFALLGILAVNMEYFTRPILVIALGGDPGLSGPDRAVDWAIGALAEGKFYALFSVLFGAGFALLWEKSAAAGGGFYGLYLRRLGILALIGLAHGTLVWSGDILLVYALCGFVMTLLFSRTAVSRLPKWMVVFVAVPVVLNWLFLISFEMSKADPAGHENLREMLATNKASLAAKIDKAAGVYGAGSWLEVTGQRVADFRYTVSHALFWVPPVLGFFLLGRWLMASGKLRDPDGSHRFFRRWTAIGFLAGGTLSLAGYWLQAGHSLQLPSIELALGSTLMAAGAPLLMLGFLSLVVRTRRSLRWLAPTGRMALTNYLLQSLFWSTFFYGYGLGMWEQIPRVWHPVLAATFFALQVLFSGWWMARFRFGPAEWLWRSLTYMKLQPMRPSWGD